MTFFKNILRLWLLAMITIALGGTFVSLRAQERPAQPPQKQSSDSGKGPGFARQLSHETREAAGEETDDKAQFKESASVKLVARLTGLNAGNAYFLSIGLNFAIIIGLVVWVARKYLPTAFSARTAAIQKAMQEAQKASDEARRRLAEIESRLMRLDVEIGMMRDSAEKEAAAEEARIQAAAQEEARKIIESAHQEIAAAAKAARRELTAYAADLAVLLAKKQIHVDAATDQALVRTFTGQLAASTEASGNGPRKGGR
jgi:F0F1-type ATP synthase membrane subunit b/b'